MIYFLVQPVDSILLPKKRIPKIGLILDKSKEGYTLTIGPEKGIPKMGLF